MVDSAIIILQLRIIIWKALAYRRHHRISTLCELLVCPMILIFVGILIKSFNIFVPKDKVLITVPTYTKLYTSKDLYSDFTPEHVYYTPKTNFTEAVIKKVQPKLKLNDSDVLDFDGEDQLVEYYTTQTMKNKSVSIIAIVFKKIRFEDRSLQYIIMPRQTGISWHEYELFSIDDTHREVNSSSNMYFAASFIALQMALDTAYIETVSNKELSVDVAVQGFPYPPDSKGKDFSQILSIISVLPVIYPFGVILFSFATMVKDKNEGFNELMKMVGLKSWMLWLGWFLNSFVIHVVSVMMVTLIAILPIWGSGLALIAYCDALLLWIFLVLYCAASVAFLFAISAFFYRPTFAQIVAVIVLMLTQDPWSNGDWRTKLLQMLAPNAALYYGFATIKIYIKRKIKLSWTNMYQSADGSNKDITMPHVLHMCIADIALYMFIAYSVEQEYPGPYGLSKSGFDPVSLLSRFWKSDNKVASEEESTTQHQGVVEPAPNLKPGIQVKNLYKKFGKLVAVNNLSFDIYEEEITVLLGHNGAGKTTTMFIITGMLSATSGKVLVDGVDINYNVDEVRKSMGLCPQHNLQSLELTVMEHLILFGMLKGLTLQQATEEAEQMLQQLNIHTKRDTKASALSGGMRRKLSLGMALIGNTKVLILDEPTSGLDPEARRELWDILLRFRGSRTILITTHFMEEADVLGDRIAIMDHGRLMCYGTSMFLKKEYSTGYNLIIVRDLKARMRTLSTVVPFTDSVVQLVTVVENKIKGAVLQLNSGSNLIFLLPHEEKRHFGELFEELENNKGILQIANFSLSVTTLEEVFLRVGNINPKSGNKDQTGTKDNNFVYTPPETISKSTGCNLFLLQLKCLLRKRKSYADKNWIRVAGAACAVILISLFYVLPNANPLTNPVSGSGNALDFQLKMYGPTNVFYGSAENAPATFETTKKYYHGLVKDQHCNPYNMNASISDVIISKGKENFVFYTTMMIIAAEFNSSKSVVNAMFSNIAYHGAPISLNMLMNAVLKNIMGEEYSIAASNLPLTNTMFAFLGLSNLHWFVFCICMVLLVAVFMYFPHKEKTTKIKQLQLMCGVSPITYWSSCYIFDLLLYLLIIFVLMICMASYRAFEFSLYADKTPLGALLIILLAYGMTVIPFVYLFHYRNTLSGAFSLFLLVGCVLVVLAIIMDLLATLFATTGEDINKSFLNAVYTLCLLPPFGLTYTILKYVHKTQTNYEFDNHNPDEPDQRCIFIPSPCCVDRKSQECAKYRSYFSEYQDSITRPVAVMICSVLLHFALLILFESKYISKGWEIIKVFIFQPKHTRADNEEDIENEMDRIASLLEYEKSENWTPSDEDDVLLVHELEKSFKRQMVVKGVSFGVKSGDCFGLLGINGAGKTTTFRMLTGDLPVISGEARILTPNKERVYLSKNSKKYLQYVGYCPQFDAINEDLTARQTLRLFAGLRGMTAGAAKEVEQWMKVLGLEEYADKKCGQYSGGTKRKLNIAMALIAGPPVVMLDEPTSGMDPISRHKLWDALGAVKNQEVKPSIILTSHSMDECEALCNRLAIMKAGQLECCGSIIDLKQQYAQGFSVMLKLSSTTLVVRVEPEGTDDDQSVSSRSRSTGRSRRRQREAQTAKSKTKAQAADPPVLKKLMNSFEQKYAGTCVLRDKHMGLLNYHILDTSKKWSQLFKEIEELKRQHPIIEDYSICETSLEEVFLSIARGETRKQKDVKCKYYCKECCVTKSR